MDLAGKHIVAWLSPEAVETFLGVLEPSQDTVLMPDGEEMRLHEEPVYFLRWELLTTARPYDALPADIRRIG